MADKLSRREVLALSLAAAAFPMPRGQMMSTLPALQVPAFLGRGEFTMQVTKVVAQARELDTVWTTIQAMRVNPDEEGFALCHLEPFEMMVIHDNLELGSVFTLKFEDA